MGGVCSKPNAPGSGPNNGRPSSRICVYPESSPRNCRPAPPRPAATDCRRAPGNSFSRVETLPGWTVRFSSISSAGTTSTCSGSSCTSCGTREEVTITVASSSSSSACTAALASATMTTANMRAITVPLLTHTNRAREPMRQNDVVGRYRSIPNQRFQQVLTVSVPLTARTPSSSMDICPQGSSSIGPPTTGTARSV